MTTPSEADVRRWLAQLPARAALLPDALSTRRHGDGGGHGKPTPAAPTNLGVVAILDTRDEPRPGWDWELGMGWCDPERVGILPYLHGWARDIEATAYESRPDLPAELPTPPTVASVCAWLLAELEWATTLAQWPEMADGIRVTWRRVEQATSHVADVHPPRPVKCDRCHEGRLEPDGPRLWRCSWCAREVSVTAVSLPMAAQALGVSPRTLQAWAKRSLLGRGVADPDDQRRRLYDLRTVGRVLAEQRLREGAGRRVASDDTT